MRFGDDETQESAQAVYVGIRPDCSTGVWAMRVPTFFAGCAVLHFPVRIYPSLEERRRRPEGSTIRSDETKSQKRSLPISRSTLASSLVGGKAVGKHTR